VTFCQDDASYFPLNCQPHEPCAQPPGTELVTGRLRGPVELFLGDSVQPIELMVAYSDGANYSDGRCPAAVFRDEAELLQSLFMDMAVRGFASSELQRVQAALSGHSEAGLAIDDTDEACGYQIIEGAGGRLGCSPAVDEGGRLDLAHEINHIWKWARIHDEVTVQFAWWKSFVAFADRYHELVSNDPTRLLTESGTMGAYDYSLENAEEWGGEIFRHWLYGAGGWSVGGAVMEREMPDFVEFFSCLWEEGRDPVSCAGSTLGASLPTNPEINPADPGAVLDGLSPAQTDAVWAVCGGGPASAEDRAVLDDLSRAVAPLLPEPPSTRFELGVGDCDHDGFLDWLCWYDGPGPAGHGDESYGGNPDYSAGTYTFVRGGRDASDLSFMQVDPYITHDALPRPGLVQPPSRTWLGPFEGCNGAVLLIDRPGWTEILLD